MSIIITLIIFTLIVVIHEGGHFLVARLCGVDVEEFAVGMGPKLFGFRGGDVEYTLRALPIGGFCRMADESKEGSSKKGFNDATVFRRIAISLAGPVMNFILAMAILIFMAMSTGIYTNEVTGLVEGYPAQEAGVQVGDRIISVNGTGVHRRDDLTFAISENGGVPLELTLKRGGEKYTVTLDTRLDSTGERQIIGVNTGYKAPMIDVGLFQDATDLDSLERATFIDCVKDGYWYMCFLVKVTALGVVRMLTLNVSMDQISGPIGVTTVVGDAYEATVDGTSLVTIYTVLTMLQLTALLSANLGVINLVPIPALDGGRIFVYIIEIIRRKKLPPEREGVINLIGFALVMGFGIFIAVNDVLKLI